MNREHRVLSAVVHNKQAYESISALVSEEDFSDDIWLIVQKIQEYYSTDDTAEFIHKDWLVDALAHDYPKHKAMYRDIVHSLDEVSVPNILTEFRVLKREAAGSALAQALLNKSPDIPKCLEKYNHYYEMEFTDEDGEIFVQEDIQDLLTAVQPDNLIKVYPSSLNERLGGGVIPGTQIAVYAPTEVGKSMLSINMASGFMHDGRRVLYCGNEDPARMMLLRFYSRLSGMNRQELLHDPVTARTLAQERGYGNLVFYEMAPGSIFDIKKAIERYEPEIVVVDQMANMDTRANFTKVEKNEYLAAQLRSIAKKYQVVTIIVHQASDSAYGKLAVEKNDMYFSNVGVQGQMDVMIGIGMDDSFEQQNKRMLCLTKNKISACHDAFPVQVNVQLSKVTDLG